MTLSQEVDRSDRDLFDRTLAFVMCVMDTGTAITEG
jgi:hypothetical protein